MPFTYLDHPRPLAFAHRGGGAAGSVNLENTVTAFQHAVDLGYRYLETDVRTTADGELVVFHDETLDRLTDRSGRLDQVPYREVAGACIQGTAPIPRLVDVLTAWPNVRFNIDVKENAAIAPFAEVLRRTNAYDRVCIASFSGRRLTRMRAALDREVCTSFGRRGVAALKISSLSAVLTRLARFRTPCVQVPPFYASFAVITPSFVRAAHQHGIQVHAWTINDAAQMRTLLDVGVDGIMTDEVETLRRVLIDRGTWYQDGAR